MDKQPHVKEESLTDWMLYKISEDIENIKYLSFTRREEAVNGADWEWWILMRNSAYRFSVQAKKLNGRDNWAAINYCNKNDTQINLLLDISTMKGSYPLYLFYSIEKPIMEKQLDFFKHPKLKSMIEWCETCVNGTFISPAFMVAELINNNKKFHLTDEKLLNMSFALSSFDWFENRFESAEVYLQVIEELLDWLERKYVNIEEKQHYNIRGFKYSYQKSISSKQQIIPEYLHMIISKEGIPKWFSIDRPTDLPDVDGIGIIDLRYTD
jgi:hypothetical protein